MVLAVESAASARLLAARKSSAHSGTATLQEGRSTVPRRLRRPAVKRPVSRCLAQRRVSQLDPDARVPQPFAARSYSRWKALVGGYLGQRIVPCLQDPEEMDAAIQPVGKKAWAHEIWSRVVYGGQAASSVCMMSLAFLTPSLKVTPPTTSVSSSDLFSRLHPLCADSASL